MADFVAEVRPRSFISQRQASTLVRDDFVAELKSKCSDQTDVIHSGSHTYPLDDPSDLHLQKILSDMKFSRESITSLLEGSILTLVEKLLTGRSILKIKGSLCISMFSDESPIVVNLYKAFPKTCSPSCLTDQVLDSNLNIKIRDRDIPTMCSPCEKTVSSCSPCCEFNRESCNSPSEAERSPQSSSGYHSGKESCFSSPVRDNHSNSSSPCPVMEDSEQLQVLDDKQSQGVQIQNDQSEIPPAASKDVANSDLSLKEKSSSVYNKYFCSGFDGKSTLFVPASTPESDTITYQQHPGTCASSGECSDEHMDEYVDDDAGEGEHRLVIDDTATTKIGEICNDEAEVSNNQHSKSDLKDFSVGVVLSKVTNSPDSTMQEDEAIESLSEDADDVESLVCSDNNDSESHMDLPGNSKCPVDLESFIPHPQSIVSKHPKGFKCKQCSSVLSNTLAVSMHVKYRHHLHCCTFCCRTFTAKNNLKRHVRRHTGQKPYKCPQCPQSFFRGDELKGHMIRHDYSKPFRCSLCKKGYTDRACVKNHMAKEHRSRLMHVCPQCGESFDNEEVFTNHKSSHPELQQFSCSKCAFIGTNNLMTLKHGLLHKHKLFSCKPCNAYFADPFQYTSHVRKHKHNSSFAQYSCCFCDVALVSYEQYVRHEYSHAQGRIHTCKTCQKQFRSKASLQDHATTHQDRNLDNSDTEQIELETMEMDKIQSLQWQPEDDHHNHISEAHEGLKSTSVETFARRFYDSDTEENLLSRLQEEENDEYFGQLLDLSMKKPSSPASSNDSSMNDQSSNGSYHTPLRTTGLSVNNVFRNGGVTSEPVNLSKEGAICQPVFAASPSLKVERHHENLYKAKHNKSSSSVAFSRSELNNGVIERLVQAASKTHSKASSKLELPNRARYAERTNITPVASSVSSERRAWLRTVLNHANGRLPLRFSPYYKEKLADLAAKFVVARGNRFAGQRGLLKAHIPACVKRRAVTTKAQDMDRKKQGSAEIMLDVQSGSTERTELLEYGRTDLASQALMDNGEVKCEYSNSETALRCHIPTVVKSEPMAEQEETADSPVDYRFQKARAEERKGDVSIMNRSSYGCEFCREEFESFLELEKHSVEVHKRYLCEHCKKSFTARPNRDRHVRYHTGERPYKCDLCDMAFFRGDDLKYHRTTRHPSAQPYICTRCSASFTWGRDLERHIRHSKCKV